MSDMDNEIQNKENLNNLVKSTRIIQNLVEQFGCKVENNTYHDCGLKDLKEALDYLVSMGVAEKNGIEYHILFEVD